MMKNIKYILIGASAVALLAVSLDADALISQNYKKALSFNNVLKGSKGSGAAVKERSGLKEAAGENDGTRTEEIFFTGGGDETRQIRALKTGDVIRINLPREKNQNGTFANGWLKSWGLYFYKKSGDSYSSITSYQKELNANMGFVGACGTVSVSEDSDNGNRVLTLTYQAPTAANAVNTCGYEKVCRGASLDSMAKDYCLYGQQVAGPTNLDDGNYASGQVCYPNRLFAITANHEGMVAQTCFGHYKGPSETGYVLPPSGTSLNMNNVCDAKGCNYIAEVNSSGDILGRPIFYTTDENSSTYGTDLGVGSNYGRGNYSESLSGNASGLGAPFGCYTGTSQEVVCGLGEVACNEGGTTYVPPCRLHIGNIKQNGATRTYVNKTLQIGEAVQFCPDGYEWNATNDVCQPEGTGNDEQSGSGTIYSCPSGALLFDCIGGGEHRTGSGSGPCYSNGSTLYSSCNCESGYSWQYYPSISGNIAGYACVGEGSDDYQGSGSESTPVEYNYFCTPDDYVAGGQGESFGGKYASCKCRTFYEWRDGDCRCLTNYAFDQSVCTGSGYEHKSGNGVNWGVSCMDRGGTHLEYCSCESGYAWSPVGNGVPNVSGYACVSDGSVPCAGKYACGTNIENSIQSGAGTLCTSNGVNYWDSCYCQNGYNWQNGQCIGDASSLCPGKYACANIEHATQSGYLTSSGSSVCYANNIPYWDACNCETGYVWSNGACVSDNGNSSNPCAGKYICENVEHSTGSGSSGYCVNNGVGYHDTCQCVSGYTWSNGACVSDGGNNGGGSSSACPGMYACTNIEHSAGSGSMFSSGASNCYDNGYAYWDACTCQTGYTWSNGQCVSAYACPTNVQLFDCDNYQGEHRSGSGEGSCSNGNGGALYTSCYCEAGYSWQQSNESGALSGYACVSDNCDASYQYECTAASGNGISGGSGTACGGKYQACSCNNGYAWITDSGGSNGHCGESCDSSYAYTCTGENESPSGTACGGKYQSCSCNYPYDWDSSTGECGCSTIYRYTCTGAHIYSHPSISCNGKYFACICFNNYGWNSSTGQCESCSSMGYLYDCTHSSDTHINYASGSDCGGKYQSCVCMSGYAWNSSTGQCEEQCDSSYAYTCTGENESPSGTACGGKYQSCSCSEGTWSNGACTCPTSYRNTCTPDSLIVGGSGTPCGGKYEECECVAGYMWNYSACYTCDNNGYPYMCDSQSYPHSAPTSDSYKCPADGRYYRACGCASMYNWVRAPEMPGAINNYACVMNCWYMANSYGSKFDCNSYIGEHGAGGGTDACASNGQRVWASCNCEAGYSWQHDQNNTTTALYDQQRKFRYSCLPD